MDVQVIIVEEVLQEVQVQVIIVEEVQAQKVLEAVQEVQGAVQEAVLQDQEEDSSFNKSIKS